MSRIGKLPITLPQGVQAQVTDTVVKVTGSKGELSLTLKSVIKAEVKEGKLVLTRTNDEQQTRAYHGLFRSLLANMVKGVNEGFTKNLEMTGVGYKAKMQGTNLQLSVGYSHPVEFIIPAGIKASVADETKIAINGIDKDLVGLVAAQIRKIKPCEPYKGKGIKYVGEVIRRKAGKSAKAGSAA